MSVSVVVATRDRAAYLPGLLAALAGQDLGAGRFEVVVVDDGSTDGTAALLDEAAASGPLTLHVVRLPVAVGPAAARNAGLRRARAEVVAFTDDDCLPSPGWLRALLARLAAGADVVQGRTEPGGAHPGGPWDRTLWVSRFSGLFETCNMAYRRSVLERVGGFDEDDQGLHGIRGGRHFGEDAVLGARAVAAGAVTAFAPEALVRHRWAPASYGDHVRSRWRLVGFPALARRSRPLADRLVAGVFLSRRSAAVDAAAVSAAAVIACRRPWFLVGVVPWVVARWPEAVDRRAGRSPVVRLAQLAVADGVGLLALLEGSARARRLVL